MRRITFLPFALLAAFALSLGATAAENLSPQTSSQSGVTVKVTPRSFSGPAWEFEVVFDTHSQELSDDLLKSAMLVGERGSQAAPSAWQGDPPGGHHRKGVLSFDALKPAPAVLELRIQRPGESGPRVFRWTLR